MNNNGIKAEVISIGIDNDNKFVLKAKSIESEKPFVPTTDNSGINYLQAGNVILDDMLDVEGITAWEYIVANLHRAGYIKTHIAEYLNVSEDIIDDHLSTYFYDTGDEIRRTRVFGQPEYDYNLWNNNNRILTSQQFFYLVINTAVEDLSYNEYGIVELLRSANLSDDQLFQLGLDVYPEEYEDEE
jgi:hypothetical protein